MLNALNTRLRASELAYIVGHAGSKVLLVDHDLVDLGRSLLAEVDVRLAVAGERHDQYEALPASRGALATYKDRSREALGGGAFRVMGQCKSSIMLGIYAASTNLRLLDRWAAKAGLAEPIRWPSPPAALPQVRDQPARISPRAQTRRHRADAQPA